MYLPSEKAKLTMYSLERLGKPLLLNPPEAERLAASSKNFGGQTNKNTWGFCSSCLVHIVTKTF